MSQERILIVDGDIGLSEILKSRFEALGYLVDCTPNALEAINILESKWFDLIITSIILQEGMDGFQLFKEIRKKKKYLKIPIVVQSKKPALKGTLESLGVEAFFVKPYSIDIFLGEIRDLLTKKILILCDNKIVTKNIVRKLDQQHDYNVEILDNAYKFYINITSYRYDLILIQSKIRTTLADMLISITRESNKNRNNPIIVFTTKKISSMDPKKAKEIYFLKDKCNKYEDCNFIEDINLSSELIPTTKMYLESF